MLCFPFFIHSGDSTGQHSPKPNAEVLSTVLEPKKAANGLTERIPWLGQLCSGMNYSVASPELYVNEMIEYMHILKIK